MDFPPCPKELEHVWQWYREMCTGEPLSFLEIRSYADLMGITFEAWEVDLLKSIDRCYLRCQMEELEDLAKPKAKHEH